MEHQLSLLELGQQYLSQAKVLYEKGFTMSSVPQQFLQKVFVLIDGMGGGEAAYMRNRFTKSDFLLDFSALTC